jgi:DNA processing protein
MERDDLAAWLRLTLTPGVGSDSARKLLAAFGLPQTLFEQSHAALTQVVTPAQAAALHAEPPGLATLLETTWAWLQQPDNSSGQRRIVALGDPGYPAPLLNIEDPPLMLYLLGRLHGEENNLSALSNSGEDATDLLANSLARSIAIVGSRNPTPQGAANARQFARALREAGLTVVSGLALGVDGAAHEGALEGEGSHAAQLATIAVVGTGLDRVYPKDHRVLAHRIAQQGLIISEYPLGTPPLAANFPRRNRLIAGLSCGTLVVEAALKSGSLITARLAAEQGKEVFAIPGSIHATQSHGCHALIKQGAKLVESAQDVLEEIKTTLTIQFPAPAAASAKAEDRPADENSLLHAMGYDPVGLDALIARTGLDAASLQAQLMALELDGQVARLPGGLFQRMGQA